MIQDIDDRNFDRIVEGAGVPVLVEFWQPGCGGCLALMRELKKLDAECDGHLLILTMNVQGNYQIPAELDISSLPALALYINGRFERFIGGLGKKEEILKQLPPL
ncbi:MAG TPA: thioredoxin family protein [Nitrospiraceae bacterium]|nr:thioredoxin family protein [Nitrospiraceae bacterium]